MTGSQFEYLHYQPCQLQLGRIEFAPAPPMFFGFYPCALPLVEKKPQDSQMIGKEESSAHGKDEDSHQTLREALEEAFLEAERHSVSL